MTQRDAEIHFDLPDPSEHWTPFGGAACACETFCIRSCCGLNAYDFSAANLQPWADSVSRETFDEARRVVADCIKRLQSAPPRFWYIDEHHTRGDVLEWFQTFHSVLEATLPPIGDAI